MRLLTTRDVDSCQALTVIDEDISGNAGTNLKGVSGIEQDVTESRPLSRAVPFRFLKLLRPLHSAPL